MGLGWLNEHVQYNNSKIHKCKIVMYFKINLIVKSLIMLVQYLELYLLDPQSLQRI